MRNEGEVNLSKVQDQVAREVQRIMNSPCHYCFGSGVLWAKKRLTTPHEESDFGPTVSVECPYCKGTGKERPV